MAELVNTPEEGSPAEVTEPVSGIPDKLQGKSAEEIAEMYSNLERQYGKQSQEVGQLRAAVDQALQSAGPQEVAKEPEVDFYENPSAYIKAEVDKALQPYRQSMNQTQNEVVVRKLNEKHPEWKETLQTKEFQDWVAGSKVRRQLFHTADSGDFDSANELFDLWSDIGKSKSQSETAARKAVSKDRKLRAVAAEKGAAGIDPRKILSRADLRSLRQTNPNRYNELLPDIKRAYAEGRVKD